MEIIRIYNNNVAVVRGDDGKEMIVIGKGLVFQKHAGDLVDETRVEKCFTLQNPRVMTKLEQLIKDMPSIYLSISEEIVEMIRSESDLKLSENIYITLTDHISMSLEREKKGVILGNPFLIEIKQFYKKEFKLAEKAADIIKKASGTGYIRGRDRDDHTAHCQRLDEPESGKYGKGHKNDPGYPEHRAGMQRVPVRRGIPGLQPVCAAFAVFGEKSVGKAQQVGAGRFYVQNHPVKIPRSGRMRPQDQGASGGGLRGLHLRGGAGIPDLSHCKSYIGKNKLDRWVRRNRRAGLSGP